MNCVIVGAGGFIGRRLGNHCSDLGHTVLGLDVVTPGRPPGNATGDAGFALEHCDVTADPVALPRGVEVVFYLAQSPHYREFPKRADHLFGVNVTGALKAAEAAERAGARLFCYASTGTVYAPGFTPMTEDRPLRRDQGYALSKICAEEALAAMLAGSESMRLLCPRLFGVFGHQAGMLVPSLADRVRDGRAVTIQPHPEDPSDRNGLRISLTFVDDVARCLITLAEKLLAQSVPTPAPTPAPAPAPAPATLGAALNVASDEAVSIRALADGIAHELGIEAHFELADRPRESDYIADTARLREMIDPTFTPLAAALAETIPSHV